MDTCRETATPADYSELVWETDGQATAQAGDVSFRAGEGAAWTPEQLLGLAAGASVMSTFFALSRGAGLTARAYVSQQRVEQREGMPRPEIVVSPCITVSSNDDAVLALAACDRAFAESTVAAALSWPIRLEPHVVVLPPQRDGSEW